MAMLEQLWFALPARALHSVMASLKALKNQNIYKQIFTSILSFTSIQDIHEYLEKKIELFAKTNQPPLTWPEGTPPRRPITSETGFDLKLFGFNGDYFTNYFILLIKTNLSSDLRWQKDSNQTPFPMESLRFGHEQVMQFVICSWWDSLSSLHPKAYPVG